MWDFMTRSSAAFSRMSMFQYVIYSPCLSRTNYWSFVLDGNVNCPNIEVMSGDAVDSPGQQTPADLGVGARLQVIKVESRTWKQFVVQTSHTAFCAAVDYGSSRDYGLGNLQLLIPWRRIHFL